MKTSIEKTDYDVVIIGAGPAGLGAAVELKKRGVSDVLVLEREVVAGGTVRHCGHPPFGVLEFGRVYDGPAFAQRIVSEAEKMDISICCNTTVISLHPDGVLDVVSPEGGRQLSAKRVIIATGTRETSRAGRLISGKRPIGVLNTGALQGMVYLKGMIPFHNPVIVGNEMVTLSSLLTCKKAGIKPAAIIEEESTLLSPVIMLASYFFGVPLYRQSRIVDICGNERVESVQIKDRSGSLHCIACDGVLLTGKFTPESTLVRTSHLDIDSVTLCPVIDGFNRCSELIYYSVGNCVHTPVKTGGACWRAGKKIAKHIAQEFNR